MKVFSGRIFNISSLSLSSRALGKWWWVDRKASRELFFPVSSREPREGEVKWSANYISIACCAEHVRCYKMLPRVTTPYLSSPFASLSMPFWQSIGMGEKKEVKISLNTSSHDACLDYSNLPTLNWKSLAFGGAFLLKIPRRKSSRGWWHGRKVYVEIFRWLTQVPSMENRLRIPRKGSPTLGADIITVVSQPNPFRRRYGDELMDGLRVERAWDEVLSVSSCDETQSSWRACKPSEHAKLSSLNHLDYRKPKTRSHSASHLVMFMRVTSRRGDRANWSRREFFRRHDKAQQKHSSVTMMVS